MNLKQTFAIKPAAVALMALMAATRFDHMGTAVALPDASLAVFFLAGLWLGGRYFFALLLMEAAAVDYWAISQMGVSDYCVSPAYAFLIPTYAAMWLAGQYCRNWQTLSLSHMALQLIALVTATSAAFLISNSSFYWLSANIQQPSWAQYVETFSHYFSSYCAATLFYAVMILAVVHVFRWIRAENSQHSQI